MKLVTKLVTDLISILKCGQIPMVRTLELETAVGEWLFLHGKNFSPQLHV